MTLRERLEELAADWASRRYEYGDRGISPETRGHNVGKEDAFHDAADELRAVLADHKDDDQAENSDEAEAERIRLFASYYR